MMFQSLFAMAMKRSLPEIQDVLAEYGTTVINLGAGRQQIHPRILNYGLEMGWNADTMPIPHGDETVDSVIMFHFLEHVADPIAMLLEIERVLKVGGVATICVPYYSSSLQAQDLTHRHAFTEETWRTLLDNRYYDIAGGRKWRLMVGFNLICGVVERNLCLLTQLVKV